LSHTIAVGSAWIKRDVVRQYAVGPEKIQIIPWGSPTAHYPPIPTQDLKNADVRLGLPASYALYPAVTWPHKNHLRLFDALALLRDRRGIVVNLVCTGARYEPHWPRVQQRLKELELEPQVRFLGFLSETDLRIVYRRSQFLILPTLFEADSCPIHEAWSEDVPVASSCLTALPEQVGDAGLLFNATEVTAIADSIQKMTTDPDLRRDLVERGRRRVKDFDWTRTAKAYRAVYRRAAGLVLNEEDRWLLEWDWMKQPQRAPGMADCYE
jgi:glycosyltransferase involved in cell wall biosynthesis